MPTYDIRHIPTGEVTERFMTIAQLEQFLKDNTDYEVAFLQMNVGDPVALGIKQPPQDFIKHVLQPIEKRTFGHLKESRFRRKTEI